jgi:hypothetical protein
MPSTVAERPSPGSWWPGDLELAGHEAGHATAAVFLGLPLEEVRIDRPDDGFRGWARTTFVPGRDAIRRRLQVVMAGPMAAVARSIPWPPSADSDQVDERNAALIRDVPDSTAPNGGSWKRDEPTPAGQSPGREGRLGPPTRARCGLRKRGRGVGRGCPRSRRGAISRESTKVRAEAESSGPGHCAT